MAKPKSAATKPRAKPSTSTTPKQKKSALVRIGEDAMRAALLAALERNGWRLTDTAAELEMSAASSVIRAIKHLGLTKEYDAARKRGEIRPGVRPS